MDTAEYMALGTATPVVRQHPNCELDARRAGKTGRRALCSRKSSGVQMGGARLSLSDWAPGGRQPDEEFIPAMEAGDSWNDADPSSLARRD